MVSLQARPLTKGKIMPPAPKIHGDIVNREIRILPDLSAIAKRAAQEFLQAATSAVAEKHTFTVILAGGSTPKVLYSLLATDAGLRAQLPWHKLHLYFGHERNLTPHHPASNS